MDHSEGLVMYYKNQNISFTPLPIEKEQELFRAYRKGSADAKEAIIRNHLLVVRNMAAKVCGPDGNLDALISEANVAMLSAMDQFDESRGYRFVTFLRKNIHGALCRFLSNCKRDGDRVTHCVSPSGEVFDDGEKLEEQAEHPTMEKDDFLDHVRDVLNKVMEQLPRKDRLIVQMRYFEFASFEQISNALGDIGVAGVRQRHKKLLVKIRRMGQEISPEFKLYA